MFMIQLPHLIFVIILLPHLAASLSSLNVCGVVAIDDENMVAPDLTGEVALRNMVRMMQMHFLL